MKIYIIKSTEKKNNQQKIMVLNCAINWSKLNNAGYKSYHDVMNMDFARYNNENRRYVALTYHLEPNKW